MLVRITCATQGCGPFHVRKRLQEVRASDHRTFYCPEGHRNFYPALKKRTDLDVMTTRRDELQRLVNGNRRENTRLARSNAALRGVITRLQNRTRVTA